MEKNKKAVWSWPDELDALIAAPEHHKLLLENDSVRVLDTLIRPNEITAVHTHKWSATLYILSWSDFVRYDDKDNVVLDSRKLDKSMLPSSPSVWSEPLGAHRLKNVGGKDLHIISVEIKNL